MPAFTWNPADAESYRDAGMEALLWRPAPRLLVTRIRGHASAAALRFYTGHAEQEMRHGRVAVFHDWYDLASYDAEARDELKRWGKRHNADFIGVHYLVRSKVIAMLISVAALTLGRDLVATTEREAFLAKLTAAIAGTPR
ncbi:hypothetical protein [Nannocystis sp.]|uniref:hypothetical protein n=1 Tax=Nannocystis sp. TaxID=1962667 RepID=UPI002421B18F|nr:hypothetical protein [Nannocystis sp.]MBK7827943.1 hypothetical protein [Nannocystis sp.]MBK9752529.1 hypothetical protein [Nannocystis sp.]